MTRSKRIASPAPPLGGYFATMGATQILLGAFHVFYSLIGLYLLLEQGGLGDTSDTGGGFGFRSLAMIYITLQVVVGWLLGALTVWAGVETRQARRRSFVRGVAIANLFYLPLGTLAGALTLLGMRRPAVHGRFIEEPPPSGKRRRRRTRRIRY